MVRRAREQARRLAGAIALLGSLLALTACPGSVSRKPPIHPNPNMDQQRRLEAQEPSDFFADGRAMRPRVEGTLPRGSLAEDAHRHRGRLADGSWAATLPRELTLDGAMLARGRERYEIYCAPCHDSAGGGQGSVVARGMTQPPSFHSEPLRAKTIGEIFGVITEGVRTMPSYAVQVPVDDRWAIAAYVRALQIARHAAPGDVPPGARGTGGREGP